MKKFKMFFSIVLLMVLTLSSCGKKEEIENGNINKISTGTESNENKEALDEVNSEVDKVIGDIESTIENTGSDEKSGNTKVSTGNTNSGTVNNTSSISESKVTKLNKTYVSPGGNDEIVFSIKTKGDKIENVTIEKIKGDETSKKIIKSFWDSINNVIVGKTIEEAKNISTVGGASLTTNAFKEALKNM